MEKIYGLALNAQPSWGCADTKSRSTNAFFASTTGLDGCHIESRNGSKRGLGHIFALRLNGERTQHPDNDKSPQSHYPGNCQGFLLCEVQWKHNNA
jgi:hypothetical protein